MKTRIIYIFSFLLLFISCTAEQHISYDGSTCSNEYCTIRLRIPNNWKIVDAQLESKQVNLEFNRGRGIEKQSLSFPFQHDNLNENLKFRGANRVNRLALLHFTDEEVSQSVFNPPIGTVKISSNIKEREKFAIFRTSNWLIIHYSIKNTGLGNLTFQDLTKRYAKNPNNKGNTASFKTIDGKLHYNLVFNNKEKRSFLINKYYGQHETYNSSSLSQSKSNDELSWTWHYKITSNQKMDR